jgi:hypothetical protein
LAALRSVGYEPSLRIEDVQVTGGGPLPVWNPDTDANQTEEPGRQADPREE